MFASLLVYYFYRRCLETGRTAYFVLLAGACAVLFYANYLLCVAFLAAVALVGAIFHRREFARGHWWKLGLAAGLFMLATVPYALYCRIWHRPDMPAAALVWYARRAKLVWWYVRDLNRIGCVPWMAAAGLAYFLIVDRRKDPATRKVVEWAALGLGFILFLALLSPQLAWGDTVADVRYFAPAIPIFAGGVMGGLAWLAHKRSAWAGLAVVLLLTTTNVLTLAPTMSKFRFLLPAYVYETHTAYPTAYEEVCDFLAANARQDDLVTARPEFHNYPLMFYEGDRVLFGCLLNRKSPLAGSPVKELDAPLFIDENYPDWLIAFGADPEARKLLAHFSRPHAAGGRTVSFRYERVNALDVCCFASQRPELFLHSFGPRKDFDRGTEAVYVFRRRSDE